MSTQNAIYASLYAFLERKGLVHNPVTDGDDDYWPGPVARAFREFMHDKTGQVNAETPTSLSAVHPIILGDPEWQYLDAEEEGEVGDLISGADILAAQEAQAAADAAAQAAAEAAAAAAEAEALAQAQAQAQAQTEESAPQEQPETPADQPADEQAPNEASDTPEQE